MFIDGRIFGLQRNGGISRLYYEILKFLPAEEYSVLFRGLARDDYTWGNVPLERNVGVRWSPSSRLIAKIGRGLEPFWLEREWRRFRKRCKSGPATYVSSYYRLPQHASGCRVLVGDYDCAHEQFPELFQGAQRLFEMKRRAFSRADLIATISESSRQDVMRFYGISGEKIKVFHLGVDQFFDRSIVDSSLPYRGDKPFLLYVGSRASYKNFTVLMEAFKAGLHKGFDLVVVGGGELSAAEKAAGGDWVTWRAADDNELRALYQQAAAFVYPSRYEGFGLPPLEALACGTPVVVADHPVFREVLSEHAEYFHWEDALGLIDAVARAVDQSEDKRELGYRHARSYTWEASARRFFSFVRERT